MRHRSRPQPLFPSLRQGDGPLPRLLSQVQRLNGLQGILSPLLQPAVQDQCRIAAYRQGVLHLVLQDAHWATRLRYQENRLVRLLRPHHEFADIKRILIKVRPPHGGQGSASDARKLADSAIDSLTGAAESIRDPALRQVLRRLARHGAGRRPAK